jgi:polynucleotide 5'-hydroxyl-kinase GRC3/NOL9
MLAKCSTSLDEKTRTVLICGPKSSGKSTFTKLLVNRLLSIHIEKGKTTKPAKVPGVALLDIDPGQPEYCPPSQLALVHIQEPNFAPPFAHPIPGPKSKIIRSHSIGAVSPSLDPELYMACVLNLFGHYRNLLLKFPNCPLVINTPGWVLGTGLEILVDLIAKISPTEVIYMSKDGPPEVVESLTEAAASNPVLTLPSQASEYTTRTAAHLRTMQYMSYFHLNPSRDKESTWITQPLTSLPPWEIRYSGDKPGIVGIICYGEQPPASLVADKINGSLVAILVIDSLNSISGWSAENQTRPSDTSGNGADESDDIDTKSETDWEHCGLSQKIQLPLILRTPEDIPYFNPANAITFDPTTSHSIGLALVRGIDKARRRIQVLTPIAPSVIEKINKAEKLMVLVSGKLDTPGWAYIEEFTQKMTLEKSSKRVEAGDVGRPEESNLGEVEDVEGLEERRTLGDGFKGAPWIEAIEGSEGRGIGSRVWRVRRDLGRDSGD